MKIYFDTALIVKLYVREQTSPRAIELFSTAQAPPLCHWQRFEARNAIRLKAFRGEITSQQMVGSLANFDADIGARVWRPASVDTEQLFRRAEGLSEAHASRLGVRTMDTVHVAAALLLGSELMATLDSRQAQLAVAVGLQVIGVG